MTADPADLADNAQEESEVLDLEQRSWLPDHCSGDRSAFGKLVAAYGELLYTFMRRHGLSQSAADDVFQETLLKVHLAAATYNSERPLKPWLFTVASNTLRNHFRSESRRRGHIADNSEGQIEHSPAQQSEMGTALDRQRKVAFVEQQIGRLPNAQREVIVLTTIAGMKMREVGEILNLPINTVKTHLHRARASLNEALTRHENRGESK